MAQMPAKYSQNCTGPSQNTGGEEKENVWSLKLPANSDMSPGRRRPETLIVAHTCWAFASAPQVRERSPPHSRAAFAVTSGL